MSKETNFEDAFVTDLTTCRATCTCGRIFYNHLDTGCFEREELESLENDENATEVDHSIGYLYFESKDYATCCDCWISRAKIIMQFIDSHDCQIAKYLNSERQRKISEAELVEVVKD